VVAVDFGYSETPIATLGADILIGHFDELGGAIDRLMPATGSGLSRKSHFKP
jgi:phosphoglycolate phosphatase